MKPEHRELLRTHGSVLASNCLVELEAAEAEVDRLRAQVEAQHACVDQAHDARCAALRDLATERAAHEATKAERDEALQYVAELEASHGHAEARIKELEGTVLCNQQAADREYVRREAAEARVAELEAELATAKAEIARLRHVENSNQCEIARLREENTRAAQQVADVVSRCGDDLATERAAHEATEVELSSLACHVLNDLVTYAELDAETERASAAEARVVELERENTALRMTNRVEEADANDQRDRRRAAEARVAELERDCYSNGHGALVVALEALDQARGLLENAIEYAGGRWCEWGSRAEGVLERLEELQGVLSSSPEPATPAATCTCGAESSGGPCLCTPATPAEKERGIKRSRYGT